MKKFYNFVRSLIYVPFKIVYPSKVVGKENFPKDGRLITVTNHLSWADIPMLALNIKGFRHFVAKKELGKKKSIYKLGKMLGVIFLDRGKADMAAIRECVNLLKSGEGLSIFPEGTRNKTDEAIKEVKAGVTMLAIKGQSPIVPIVIQSKPRPFHRVRMYVGEPFSLTEFSGRRLDTEALEQAANVVEEKMRLAKEYIDDYVENKRWIENKKVNKQKNKLNKELYKKGKKQYSQYLRNSRRQKV